MRKSRIIFSLSIAGFLAAVCIVLLAKWNLPPRVDQGLHKAIGRALAEQALALLGPEGEIVVITRDTDAFKQPALAVLLKAFQKEARRASVEIATVHQIQVDPLRPVEVPPGDFFEFIRRAPKGQVIVSFLGPPLLLPEQRNRLGPIQPKIVAFCSGGLPETVDLDRLFADGLLHAAVVAKPLDTKGTRIPSEFDELYSRVTAESVSELSSHASGS